MLMQQGPATEDAPGDFEWGSSTADFEARYDKLKEIGSGVYGTVYQAKDRQTNEVVAIKHLRLDGTDLSDGVPAQILREVCLLKDFVHPNIAQLLSIHIHGLTDYNLVFEYIDIDLHNVLKKHRKAHEFMPMQHVNKYSQELLNGLHACHVRQIIHRDLKPQNILIGKDGLKICDFGLARIFSMPIKPYTHDVITLWYRAPEILLGVQRYGPAVDIWSAGCIVAEMATGSPMFPGDSEIGTIFKILRLLGTPTEETWPGFDQLEHWKTTFPKWPNTNLEPVLLQRPELGENGVELIRKLLDINPDWRLRLLKAKRHPFFAQQQTAAVPQEDNVEYIR